MVKKTKLNLEEPIDGEANKDLSKDENYFLHGDKRAEIAKKLQNAGINTADLNDTQLIDELSKYAAGLQQKVLSAEGESIEGKLNGYAAGCYLTDKKFISRLFYLNVPNYYLPIFTDQDMALDDKALWEKIRFSKIKPPLNRLSDIYRRV